MKVKLAESPKSEFDRLTSSEAMELPLGTILEGYLGGENKIKCYCVVTDLRSMFWTSSRSIMNLEDCKEVVNSGYNFLVAPKGTKLTLEQD